MKLILCIGDSLTAGYGVAENTRWSNLLAERNSFEVINRGISGDTSTGIMTRFNSDLLSLKPDIAIIMGGTNDLWFNLPINQIIANICSIIRHSLYSQVKPIIGLPPLFFYRKSNIPKAELISPKRLSNKIVTYRQELTRFLEQDKQLSIDFSLGLTESDYLTDFLHPNESGHQKMSDNVQNILEKNNFL